MTNVVQLEFPKREAAEEPKVPGEIPLQAEISQLCMAVAYYVVKDRQEDANKLLNYLRAHNPLPDHFTMPNDIAALVDGADWGEAMFPSHS